MWCDRQPGSQPSISANEHDLFAGLGAVGGGRRMILKGLFAFLQSFGLQSVLGGSEEGTDMMMAFIMLPWSEMLHKVIISCVRPDFDHGMISHDATTIPPK